MTHDHEVHIAATEQSKLRDAVSIAAGICAICEFKIESGIDDGEPERADVIAEISCHCTARQAAFCLQHLLLFQLAVATGEAICSYCGQPLVIGEPVEMHHG